MENNHNNQVPASDINPDASSAKSESDARELFGKLIRKLPTHPTRFSTPEEIEADDRRRRHAEYRKFLDSVMASYQTCTLESFECRVPGQKKARDAMIEYASNARQRVEAGEGILLYGPSGTGKDHLAIGVVRQAIRDHGCTAARINVQDWFGDLRDMMGADCDKRERDEIWRLTAPDMLLLSDPLPPIGALTQHQATMLYRLVCKRYEMGRPTLITINIEDREEADRRLGAAIWDRMKDRAWVVPCNWESNRKPARFIETDA